ncbi:MAG TPA: RiPP maturation radical SAM C-methyltransferase [Candidatus Deferrimicrobium sp.]|nr:RiPP maturation radical SAM C-methyltransferase [Candidatus Deferrimicrobium sp.]
MSDIRPGPKVLLISMPWAPRNYAPIRLGVLKAALETRGISCHTENLFLRFAERIDAKMYDRIAMSLYSCVGEWLFNVSLCPDSGNVEYLDYLAHCTKSQSKLFGEPDASSFDCISDTIYRDQLIKIRNTIAPEFLSGELERLIHKDYDIVGFSCVVNQLMPSLALAKYWKERKPGTLIVFGGASVQAEMGKECLRAFPWVDVIVDGEGDITLPELVRFHRSNPDKKAWQTSAPQGLMIRGADEILSTGNRNIIKDIDRIPIPDYTDYFAALKEMTNAPANVFIQFEASRGCWWGQKSNCLFCGLNSNSIVYRSKSPERTLAEILTLAGKYRSSQLYAVDTICGPTMFKKVLPKLRESGYDLSLFLEVHPTMGREHLQVLKEAGVHLIQPGIESFSTEILQIMRKGVDAIRNIRFLKWCRELGIEARYNFLWGFPGELAESYQAVTSSIPSLVHLGPPTYPPCRVLFQRFSPLFTRTMQDENLILKPQKDYQYVYPPHVDANKLASAFEHPLPYPSEDNIDYIQPLAKLLKEWQNRYFSFKRPMLVYTSGPGFVEIFDTRGEEAQEYILTGLAAAIVLLCSDICLRDTIVDRIRSTWGDKHVPEVAPILEMLEANRLVYREDDRYLTLAISRRKLQEEINLTSQLHPKN